MYDKEQKALQGCFLPSSPIEQIQASAGRFWRQLSLGLRNGINRPSGCFYHDVLNAGDLFAPENFYFGEDPDAEPPPVSAKVRQNLLRYFLEDRIVIVGQNVDYLSDYVVTPSGQYAPGPIVHAMALDNLIESGASAQRTPPANGVGNASLADILSILALAGALLLMIWREENNWPRAFRKWPRWLFNAAIALMFGGALTAYSHFVKSWPMAYFWEVGVSFLFAAILYPTGTSANQSTESPISLN